MRTENNNSKKDDLPIEARKCNCIVSRLYALNCPNCNIVHYLKTDANSVSSTGFECSNCGNIIKNPEIKMIGTISEAETLQKHNSRDNEPGIKRCKKCDSMCSIGRKLTSLDEEGKRWWYNMDKEIPFDKFTDDEILLFIKLGISVWCEQLGNDDIIRELYNNLLKKKIMNDHIIKHQYFEPGSGFGNFEAPRDILPPGFHNPFRYGF